MLLHKRQGLVGYECMRRCGEVDLTVTPAQLHPPTQGVAGQPIRDTQGRHVRPVHTFPTLTPERIHLPEREPQPNITLKAMLAQIPPLGRGKPPPRENFAQKVDIQRVNTPHGQASHVLTKSTSQETSPMLAGNTEQWRHHWK